MKVIDRKPVFIPDNQNHAPNVVPLPLGVYEGTISAEGADLIKAILNGEDDDL